MKKSRWIKKMMVTALTAAMILPLMVPGASDAKKKISLSEKKVVIYVGNTKKLKVNGTKKKAVWKSSKKKIATVSKKGKITAKRAGKTKITAKVAGKKLVCRVTVKKKKAVSVQTTAAPAASQAPAVTVTAAPTAVPVSSASATPSATPMETPFVSIPSYETGTPEEPQLSKDAGVYDSAFKLQMASQPGTDIYYTTDGSIPTTASTKYTAGFDVVCRNNMPNILCAAENIKKMYIEGSGYDYTPSDAQVAKCTVIRAAAIAPNGKVSKVVTKSFFVGNDLQTKYAGANVVSLVIDPDYLLNYETGIHVLGKLYDEWKETAEGKKIDGTNAYYNYVGNYTQSGSDWERTANMEYIDNTTDNVEFSVPIGVRGHGGASRMYGQKSFNLYMREEYGQKNLKYALLPGDTDKDGKQIKKYKSFMLRNGGNDTEYTKIRDVFTQSCLTDRAFATQAATPCVLFLNGEYWGLYNMTEKYSDNSLEENFGIDKDNVVVFKEGELDEGKDEDQTLYDELLSYKDKDFTDASVYSDFCNIMDIDSFADYYATEIYIANNDWNALKYYDEQKNLKSEKNVELWRSRTAVDGNVYGDCKWRYLVYDTEFAMGLYGSSKASTKSFTTTMQRDALFAAVMQNTEFRAKFLTTIKEIGSVNFNYDTCCTKLDDLTALYQPLMQDFYTRFYGEKTWLRSQFAKEVTTMKSFLKDRYSYIVKDVENYDY